MAASRLKTWAGRQVDRARTLLSEPNVAYVNLVHDATKPLMSFLCSPKRSSFWLMTAVSVGIVVLTRTRTTLQRHT